MHDALDLVPAEQLGQAGGFGQVNLLKGGPAMDRLAAARERDYRPPPRDVRPRTTF